MRTEVSSLAFDSRQVRADSIFFAVDGMELDGHEFIPEAILNGAAAVVSERPSPKDFSKVWVRVPEIRRSMAEISRHYYGNPSSRIRLIGITGTNGKTTTAYLIHSILSKKTPSLLMGTIETYCGSRRLPAIRTTPEASEIQRLVSMAVKEGCQTGVVEVSSHALALERTYGCEFEVGVFTNLSQDHLDFHGTMQDYLQAKQRLFELAYNPGLKIAILNGDDPCADRLQVDPSIALVTFGFEPSNDVYPITVETGIDGIKMDLELSEEKISLESRLVGQHNVYNIIAAVTACHALGVSQDLIREGVADLKSVPGRFERVDGGSPFSVFVDFAHTPDGLENVLRLARQMSGGRVICVFGCGGDRDISKRPKMGGVAAKLTDALILTSDNPRSESPQEIIRQIEIGIPEGAVYQVIEDRRSAIEMSFRIAKPGDLVLIAGKGHEIYQEFRQHQIEFSDVVVAKELHDRNFSR